MKPTEEQIQKFWEHFGFRLDNEDYPMVRPMWENPEGGMTTKLPKIDLNNLFKWVTLPYIKVWKDADCSGDIFYMAIATIEGIKFGRGYDDKDPALALFWAIYKVIENETRE